MAGRVQLILDSRGPTGDGQGDSKIIIIKRLIAGPKRTSPCVTGHWYFLLSFELYPHYTPPTKDVKTPYENPCESPIFLSNQRPPQLRARRVKKD